MRIPLFQVDAFTSRVFGGNPAAVALLDSWLPDAALQAIAEENNLAETAFVVRGSAGWELRWFTPNTEVDLCGHATLAAADVLLSHAEPAENGDLIEFATRSGALRVRRDADGLVMDFPARPPRPVSAPPALLESLAIAPREVLAADDYFVVYDSEHEIRALAPDFALLSCCDLRGVICTAPGDEVDFVSRFFAPRVGIDEDAVTGSAHTSLTPYWAARLGKQALTARQLSVRGGALWCENAGERVLIKGQVALYMKGEIELDD